MRRVHRLMPAACLGLSVLALSASASAAPPPLLVQFGELGSGAGQRTNPRGVLSDDGERLFFESLVPLAQGDTNAMQDVYQWEAQGKGSCADPGGCTSLISSGQSPQDSSLVDASADGASVFFKTAAFVGPGNSKANPHKPRCAKAKHKARGKAGRCGKQRGSNRHPKPGRPDRRGIG